MATRNSARRVAATRTAGAGSWRVPMAGVIAVACMCFVMSGSAQANSSNPTGLCNWLDSGFWKSNDETRPRERRQRIEACIQAGADPSLEDKFGNNILHLAIKFDAKNFRIIDILRLHIDVNNQNHLGMAPLHIAACCGTRRSVERLIEFGAQVDIEDNKGDTPLHYSARDSNISTGSALLRNGADPNATNDEDRSPLHFLARQKSPKSKNYIHRLMELGANPNLVDKYGRTPLHHASMAHSERNVKYLLDKGADPSMEDALGVRPVWYAEPDTRTHKFLVDSESDVGNPPSGDFDLYCNWFGSDFWRGPVKDKLGACRARRYALDSRDDEGWTALHFAALYERSGNRTLFKMLVEGGIDVNTPGRHGTTPLHIAAARSWSSGTRALIELGADVNALDNQGFTALQAAVSRGDDVTVKALLTAGAIPTIGNLATPAQLACSRLDRSSRRESLETIIRMLNGRIGEPISCEVACTTREKIAADAANITLSGFLGCLIGGGIGFFAGSVTLPGVGTVKGIYAGCVAGASIASREKLVDEIKQWPSDRCELDIWAGYDAKF